MGLRVLKLAVVASFTPSDLKAFLEGRVTPAFSWRHLRFSVSPDQQERAFAFLNRLLHVCEHEDISVFCDVVRNPRSRHRFDREREPPYGATRFKWGEGDLSFHLKETYRRVEKEEQGSEYRIDYDFVPTGKLEFSLFSSWGYSRRANWRDGKRQRIEDFFLGIANGIKAAAEWEHADRLRREDRDRQSRIQEELALRQRLGT